MASNSSACLATEKEELFAQSDSHGQFQMTTVRGTEKPGCLRIQSVYPLHQSFQPERASTEGTAPQRPSVPSNTDTVPSLLYSRPRIFSRRWSTDSQTEPFSEIS